MHRASQRSPGLALPALHQPHLPTWKLGRQDPLCIHCEEPKEPRLESAPADDGHALSGKTPHSRPQALPCSQNLSLNSAVSRPRTPQSFWLSPEPRRTQHQAPEKTRSTVQIGTRDPAHLSNFAHTPQQRRVRAGHPHPLLQEPDPAHLGPPPPPTLHARRSRPP